jgi:hypothetical protein
VTVGSAHIGLRQRRLYIAREIYETYFAGGSTVILLRKERDLLVLPVRYAASGGYVLKIRNAAGDRVVDAGDFFRDHGLDDGAEWEGTFSWCETSGGLRLYEVFLM